jgi:dihydrofolate synthase/folylpolyglutamate synthase
MEVWRINLNPMSHEEYADIMEQVKYACDRMVEKGLEHPTIFEVETAMAFLYFYQKKCDYVLLEVGMGGRTDATNLIQKPVCSVITSVSMDHMQFLGGTLSEIAYAKAGIIKKDCPVVTTMQKEAAMEVIKAEAEKQHARLFISNTSKVTGEKDSIREIQFAYPGIGTVTTHLTGAYQVENACLAIKVLKEVLKIADQTIIRGIEKTVWPGRFEIVGKAAFYH